MTSTLVPLRSLTLVAVASARDLFLGDVRARLDAEHVKLGEFAVIIWIPVRAVPETFLLIARVGNGSGLAAGNEQRDECASGNGEVKS